ncbi:MAG TPA: EamA family transporter [Gaiellaceae bacterium]|nr:EamA family transporter [Gaiellaceae bacterium]
MRRSTGIALVALAAALWGLDALFRKPLAESTPVATIVFGEHLVLVAIALPFLVPAFVAVVRLGPRYVLAAVMIGAGASALATILFTQAFVDSANPVTPVVLQKVQPIVAVIGAWVILRERPRPLFGVYFAVALAGIWLIAFPSPTSNVFSDWNADVQPVLFALGAACLWAFGTVLGRYLTRRLRFEHVTTLRFAFGLPASAIALLVLGDPAFASLHDTLWIAILALVTGAVAVTLYYYGLRSTPAVAATLAELAFPVTAALVGYLAFDATLTSTQWLGVAVTTSVVALLPTRQRDVVEVVPAPVPAAA